ncbi:MAG TPA: DUF4124 domain-containing protein [Smithellaceae bacterium]|nr:DUF4124 domain-containing protein [Smithellaceae bacterium]
MLKYLFWPALLIFIISGTATADFYKWEDEKGVVHITDYPPPARAMQKKMKVHKYDEAKTTSPQAPINKKNNE